MAVVRDYMKGATRIIFDDTYYKGQTDEEAEEVIKDYCRIAYPQLKKQYIESLNNNKNK